MNKIEMGKQYQTRGGREVRIYATDGSSNVPVHGAAKDDYGEWIVMIWSKNGKACTNDEHPWDLIEIKPRIKRDVWVNVYQDGRGSFTRGAFGTKEEADKYSNHCNRIACVKFTIDCEEGEGL